MFPVFTGDYWGEAHHVYCGDDRSQSEHGGPSIVTSSPAVTRGWRQPPAKGGSTSITAPSSSVIDSLWARPTGSAFTRNDDRAMTVANRVSGRRLAMTASSASRRVIASTGSSAMPAASFAAAQYLIVTLAMFGISSPQRDLGRCCPRVPSVFIQITEPSHPGPVPEDLPTRAVRISGFAGGVHAPASLEVASRERVAVGDWRP